MSGCSVVGCNRKRKYRRLCGMHYQRVRLGNGVGDAKAKKSPNGTGYIGNGYLFVRDIPAHVLVVEKVLGKPLPDEAVVHHVNGDKLDNRPENLVVCPNQSYHVLIHQRQRALEACGHAGWLRCIYCKKYDDPKNLYIRPDRNNGRHRSCESKYKREKRNATL